MDLNNKTISLDEAEKLIRLILKSDSKCKACTLQKDGGCSFAADCLLNDYRNWKPCFATNINKMTPEERFNLIGRVEQNVSVAIGHMSDRRYMEMSDEVCQVISELYDIAYPGEGEIMHRKFYPYMHKKDKNGRVKREDEKTDISSIYKSALLIKKFCNDHTCEDCPLSAETRMSDIFDCRIEDRSPVDWSIYE